MPKFEKPSKGESGEAIRVFAEQFDKIKRRNFYKLVPVYQLLAEHEGRMLGSEDSVKTSIQEFVTYCLGDAGELSDEALDRINGMLANNKGLMEAYLQYQMDRGEMNIPLATDVFRKSYPDEPLPEFLSDD